VAVAAVVSVLTVLLQVLMAVQVAVQLVGFQAQFMVAPELQAKEIQVVQLVHLQVRAAAAAQELQEQLVLQVLHQLVWAELV
jgi:hypothetical protein